MSELTVPVSRARPGVAARPVARDAGGFGQAVGGFGDVVRKVAGEATANVLNTELQSRRLEYTRALGDARLEVEQLGDPDAVDKVWPERVAEIRDRTFGGDRPVDPRIRDRLDLSFKELADSHALAIGRQSLDLRRSRQLADNLTYTRDVVAQAGASDEETSDELLSQAAAAIDDLVAANLIPAEEGAKRKLELVGEVDNARAIQLVTTDPAAALAQLEAGRFASLGPEAVARYTGQAQGAIARAEEAAKKEADRQAKERSTAIGQRLDEMADIFGDGRSAVDEAWLASPEVRAHPKFGETMAALDLRNEQARLPLMTVPELDALIVEERKKPVVRKYQTERLQVLEKLRGQAADGWGGDAIAYARDTGFNPPELPDPAGLSDPKGYAAAISGRLAFAEDLRTARYTDRLTVFDDAEAAALRVAAGPDADPSARVALAGALNAGLQGDMRPLGGIVDDPVFLHVGGLIGAGGSQDLAREIFRGEQVIDKGSAILPPVKDRIEPVFQQFGGLFGDIEGGEAIQAGIMKAADALYAARIRSQDPTGAIDTDVYTQALHEVLGGRGQVGTREATGGVQDVRGRQTLLPPRISAAAAERALDRVGLRAIVEAGRYARKVEPDEGLAQAQFAAASLSGSVPMVGGKPMTRDMLDNYELEAVGSDQYRLVRSGRAVLDAEGQDYVFSLGKLIREVGQ